MAALVDKPVQLVFLVRKPRVVRVHKGVVLLRQALKVEPAMHRVLNIHF